MKKIILLLTLIFLLVMAAGCGGGSSSPSTNTQYTPSGTVTAQESGDWATIVLSDNSATIPYDYTKLTNNVWNKGHAAPGPTEQSIFTETIHGNPAIGWQWNWGMSTWVVAYPEVVYGLKPWDTSVPYESGGKFPFRAGSTDVTANFDIRLRGQGKFNMAFSMWAISDLAHGKESTTHEIMIWNYSNGLTPAGTKRGTLKVDGVDFDVYIMDVHGDDSGSSAHTWKYVAFQAKSNVLHGPFHISQFIDYMIENNIMTNDVYICNVELGNEITGGSGMTEIQNFSIDVTPRVVE